MSGQFEIGGRYVDTKIEVVGDRAIERYRGEMKLTPKVGGEGIEVKVKGIHIYQRQSDGSWRMSQDIWNTDSPL